MNGMESLAAKESTINAYPHNHKIATAVSLYTGVQNNEACNYPY